MELERLFKCHCSHEPDDDIDSDIETVPTVINEGFMLKKGAICQNWKKRYFELFDDGKLVYYTDENKQIRRGIADISNVIRFNVVDNKTFEVTTPQRIWCFQCKFKSECEYWIESMKAVQHSQLHQDGASPKVWDHLNLSANESVHKFIAKMGSPDEERILYSDRIIVNNQDGDDQHQKSTVLMLTTAAIYHLRPNQNNNFKKCDRRIPWRDVGCCDVVNPQEMCIENMLYLTETENLKSILRTLCSVDVKVMFQREEDQMMLQTNPISEEDDDEDLVDSLPMKSRYVHTMTSSVQSGSEMKEIYDTDHEVEDEQHHKHHALPSYIESGSENKEPEEMECPAMRSLRVTDFTIISVIGRGTFGKILMVKKKSDGAVFAMKILKKTQIIQDAQTLNIKAERKVLKSIDHPFLMKLRYAFQSESKLYFVLDYYRGGDLNHHLQQRGSFNEEQTKFIAAQIALAIGCLHSHGIVYRDLKPENILLDDVGNCCLCDFGLCKKLSDPIGHQLPTELPIQNAVTKTPCGTPHYVAPEVIKRVPYDQNVDWWALGVLIFELTVGVVPFFSEDLQEILQKILSAQLRFPSWMEGDCRHLIRSLLQRTVSQRLGFLNDIDDIKAHQWFDDVDWNLMLQKKVDPPYCPNVDPEEGMESRPQNVAQRYLEEAAVDTFAREPDADGAFDQFTFDEGGGVKRGSSLLSESRKCSQDTEGGGDTMTLRHPVVHIFNNLSDFDDEILKHLKELENEEERDEEENGNE